MPSRNIYKTDLPESFYHVYARGGSKQTIFHDANDYLFFLQLFARYLSIKQDHNKAGVLYPHYRGKIELSAYCLMPNHFHLLVYQKEQRVLPALMHSLLTSYSRYFNAKYQRTGALFESRYKASLVSQQQYLEHISRYIHLNPRYWRQYPFSSLPFYFGQNIPEWIWPHRIMTMFAGRQEYLQFLEDYEDQKLMLEEMKHLLADG